MEIASDIIPPIMTVTPTPLWRSAMWGVPLLIATIAMLALTVIFWPVKAILRWRYDQPFELYGLPAWLYRGTRAVALVDLVFFAGWAIFLTLAGDDLTLFTDKTNGLIHGLQILGMIGIAGVFVPFWDLLQSLPDRTRPWWTKVTTLLVALACVSTVWFAITEKLVGWSLNY